MQTLRNTSKPGLLRNALKCILAAFSFFTRLPLWRLAEVEKEHYERVTPLWPLVGWLTGGVMAMVFFVAATVLPVMISVMMAFLSRILLTGALHEDGFADFCDGFGGGTTRERTLEIMKDSHIGTYGVLGLILYFLLVCNMLCELPLGIIIVMFMVADPFCKYISSTIVYFLPYARKAEEAKNKLVYARVSAVEKVISFFLGVTPLVVCVFVFPYWLFDGMLPIHYILYAVVLPIVAVVLTAVVLFRFMHCRIGGYTGDCCGATFIILEAVAYLFTLISLSFLPRLV